MKATCATSPCRTSKFVVSLTAPGVPRVLPERASARRRVQRMATVAGSAGNKTKTGSTKRPGQELERNTVAPAYMAQQQQHASTSTAAAAASMAAQPVGYSYEDVPRQPVPLKYVVQEAVKRWFEDTLQEAQRGDVKQQALLGQMYAEGYGTNKDTKLAKEWGDRAASRGYRMQGVYCEL